MIRAVASLPKRESKTPTCSNAFERADGQIVQCGFAHPPDQWCPAVDEQREEARRARIREHAEAIALSETFMRRPAAPLAPVPSTAPTLNAFVKEWTDGELHRKYPDHIKKIDQDDNRERLAYVCAVKLDVGPYATVGDVQIADGVFTVEHALAGMTGIPEGLSQATRAHVARALNRVLNLAVFPCRILTHNPLPKGFVPPAGKPPARAWWRPDDDAKLCAAREVELVYRVFYGFTFREGCRESEAGSATWRDVSGASFTLDENKTDDPRAWALYPGTSEALAVWKKMVAAAGLPTGDDDPIFVHLEGRFKGNLIHIPHLAADFRRDVKAANVWRPDFAEKKREDGTRARKQLDFHDLRGGFVSWALATGRTEAWVTDRTGHTSSTMLYRYKRRTRHAVELSIRPPESLLDAIPELREFRSPPPPENPGRGGSHSSGGSTRNDRSAAGTSRSGGMADAVDSKAPAALDPPISADFEGALLAALRGATDAGQWAAVAAVATAIAAVKGKAG